MSFVLVYGERQLALPLRFEAHIEAQLVQLLSDSEPEQRLLLSSRVVQAVTSMIDTDVVPPSDKQVKYAIAIARELSLQIPPSVLQYREAMAEFLSTHAETYRRSRVR